MVEKGDENELDFSSLNKYFIEEGSEVAKPEPVKVNVITEDVSISESSFVSYNYAEEDGVGVEKAFDKVEKISDADKKKISPAKKKFLKDLDEADSLTVDTCTSVGQD